MSESPEQRRDAALNSIIQAGGVVLNVTPLATEEAPHVVAHYHLSVGAPDLEVRDLLADIRQDTEIASSGLIPWTPEPAPEPVYEETPWEEGDIYPEEG